MANNVTDLGKVGITLKGEWSSATNYERLDAVTYDGSLYIAIKDNANVNPGANPTYWLLSAKHGEFTQQQLDDFKAEVVAESKEEMDDYTDTKKAELDTYEGTKETELNTYTGTKKTELDTYAGGLKSDFDDNASTKTTAFNDNATSKTTTFNTNATNKTTDFNDNASAKTTAFNTNASDKTTAFDNNASAKQTAFDSHVEDKTDEFDEHTEEMQQEIDELSANMPWATPEQATEFNITDAAKYSKNKLELFGNTEQASTTGKNLLDTSLLPITAYGLTISKDDSGNIVINGTPNYQAGYKSFTIGQQKTVDAGTYTTSLANKKVGLGINVGGFGGYLNITMADTVTSKTSTSSETSTIQCVVNIRHDAGTFDNYILNPMLELGSTATDYEPYTNGASPNPDYPQDIHVVTGNNTISVGSTNYPINLGSLELCKIGDYQDYLYKENGNWYKYGAIDKYVYNKDLTGNGITENIIGVLTPELNLEGDLSVQNLGAISLCNMLKSTRMGNNNPGQNTGLSGTTSAGKIRMYMSTIYATTYAEAGQLCADNNLTIYFGAKTPVITQITDETLISQLDAIYEHFKLLKGTNHITVTAEDLAPNMKLNYMQDQQKKFENIINSTYTNVMEGEY